MTDLVPLRDKVSALNTLAERNQENIIRLKQLTEVLHSDANEMHDLAHQIWDAYGLGGV